MLFSWGHVGFLLLLALVFPIGGIAFSWLLGLLRVRPQAPDPIKKDTYERGVETEGTAWVQFNFRYYYYALLFVIFDVEAVFLYPWAVSFEKVALAGFIEVLTFVMVLLIGLAYAWPMSSTITTVLSGFDVAQRIQQKLPNAIADATPEWAEVKADRLVEACSLLRDDPELELRFLSSLCGVDRLGHFAVVYHFLSLSHN